MTTLLHRLWFSGAACAVVLSVSAAAPAAEPSSPAAKPPASPAGVGSIDRLLETIRQRQPDEYERLSRLRAEHPAQFEAELRRRLDEARRRLRDRAAARTNAPAADAKPAATRPPAGAAARPAGVEERVDELMRRINQAAERYRRLPPSQQAALAVEIREMVAAVFDLRENDRTQRVNRLQKELERLKKELDRRRSLRDQIIDRKVAEILGTDPTAW